MMILLLFTENAFLSLEKSTNAKMTSPGQQRYTDFLKIFKEANWSYRNQPIDLQSKSIDWFLYEGNTGT